MLFPSSQPLLLPESRVKEGEPGIGTALENVPLHYTKVHVVVVVVFL